MGDIAIKLIYNVGILFLMMVPGVILKKCKLSTDGFGKGISNLVLYIAQPALVFLAYVRSFDRTILINSVYILILSAMAHTLFAFAALALFKTAPDNMRRMLRFTTIFSNAAFMGIPLISAVLGDEATIYASVYNITFNLFLWSLGVYICTDDRDEDGDGVTDGDVYTDYREVNKKKKSQASLLKALLHPVTIAAALGLIVFLLPIESYIPTIINDGLVMLKNLVAPLSMVVIGLRLVDIDFRGIFKDKHMYLFLALRHFVLPLIVMLVMRFFMLLGLHIDKTVFSVIVIMAATPAASSATMLAEKFDCDATYASKLVAVSTVLSILTMPVVVMLSGI